MKVKRKIIEINEELCDGCGQCAIACAEGAIEIIDGKAKVISDNLCDGLGACIGDCPTGALKIIEREAADFDEAAVEKHLEQQKKAEPVPGTMACGCPSTQIQAFMPPAFCKETNGPISGGSVESALSHWPVQIKLVPANAPFLKGADLLVIADCVAVAFPTLHRDLLPGKAVMMGCPKFDDGQEYIGKFTEVFSVADIKSVTCVFMEVPCCSGLPLIVKKGLDAAGKEISIKEMIISPRGKILKSQ